MRENTSQSIAPIEPEQILYTSHPGEFTVIPISLTLAALVIPKLMVTALIPIIGSASIMRFLGVGSVPRSVNAMT